MKNLNFARAKKLNSNDKGLKMTFLELAEEVLKQAKYPLDYRQIWEQAKTINPNETEDRGQTPWETMGARLFVDVRDKVDSKFIKIGSRPARFWLKVRENEIVGKESEIEAEIEKVQKQEIKIKEKSTFHERDLHPLLVKFLFESEKFNLYCKTIYHEKSLKGEKGKDRWNYPDIVGIHFPFDDYTKETLDLLKNLNKPSYKIYSFELKKSISWADLKEYYFQAVSNSSWANEGYLVVFENIDDEIFSELVRLNASFGIGVVQLEMSVLDSKVLLPAKQRSLDTQTLNMLTEKNTNFKEFIDDVNKDINANDKFRIAKNRYDEILSDEMLEKHLKSKNINKEE